jgi:hypothetical protein
MSDSRVLRRIFGPKREEIRGVWGKLHNEELHQMKEMGGACSMYRRHKKCVQNFIPTT